MIFFFHWRKGIERAEQVENIIYWALKGLRNLYVLIVAEIFVDRCPRNCSGPFKKFLWILHDRPTDRPPDRPSGPQAYQCKITQSTGMTTQMQLKVIFGRKYMAARTFRKKKQQQSRVFLGVIFYIYTNVDNKERARASY